MGFINQFLIRISSNVWLQRGVDGDGHDGHGGHGGGLCSMGLLRHVGPGAAGERRNASSRSVGLQQIPSGNLT